MRPARLPAAVSYLCQVGWISGTGRSCAAGRRLPGIGRDLRVGGDPAYVGVCLDVCGGAAETGGVSRVAHSTERRLGVVVDGLVVDVCDAGRDTLGELDPGGDVRGDNAEREPELAVGCQLGGFADGGERGDGGDRTEYLVVVGGYSRSGV